MKKIRVLVIEDSKVVRQLLEHTIASDPRLEIAAAVGSAEDALRILDRISPDVISMDISLPGMNGLDATRRIMSERPTPIVVISAGAGGSGSRATMEALQAGALTVLEKPSGVTAGDYSAQAERICTQIVIMSTVKLVRRRRAILHPPQPRTFSMDRARPAASGDFRLMGIVCSTGGPNALTRLLGSLGPRFPLPIAIVQHIAGGFLEDFASWLESACPFRVTIVRRPTTLSPGQIYLAAPDRHLRVRLENLTADEGEPVWGQRPSGTVLFRSMAAELGPRGLGILLTGMGEDGADGLLDLRNQGGHTIAEDESTAVVYGMPAEAVRLGAVCESLPLPAIAPRILDLTSPLREVA